ncbi:hypothetical protein GH714_002707 [Hevea brasiliensis]|uniref:Uncharacterized protein n=1 Tax=Hevea brasiliensis TaxID=3981 RepID=A0A6A6KFU4_HEVBR|nr:hypothetical protein GH714_002707 [Hevea brasiliensis]
MWEKFLRQREYYLHLKNALYKAKFKKCAMLLMCMTMNAYEVSGGGEAVAAACKTENESSNEDPVKCTVPPFLPNDSEIAAAFVERKKRRSDAAGVEKLLDLPSITGAFMVALAIGDIIIGDMVDPEVVVSVSPSVGGLLDSLTGSIGISGISSRAKPVAAPVASATPSSTAAIGAVASDAPKIGSRPLDKDALRNFISGAMPFGTPWTSTTNIFTVKVNGFSSSDLPPSDLKQPAWKPYLYKGKQRILFTIHEIVHAAMYDRDDISDTISIAGQINCRAELEGLPDVSLL